MPRRNKLVKHTPYSHKTSDAHKTRYRTKKDAEQAAELRMLQVMNLELTVYQGQDGGWYLTSKTSRDE